MPTGYHEFRECSRRQRRERQLGLPDRPPPAKHGHERHCSLNQFWGKSVWITTHSLQEADDPLLVRNLLIPKRANLRHECPRSLIVLAQRECTWLEQCHR